MPNTKLGEMQFQFAELVWHYAPLPSGELVRICQQELNWKKPTTYTVLRKLCEKGLFKNEDGLVSVLMTRELLRRQIGAVCRGNFWRIAACLYRSLYLPQEAVSSRDR